MRYLLEHSPAAAHQLQIDLAELLAALDAKAFDGPEVRLKTGRLARSWPLSPLRVFYQRRGDELYVVHIHHQRRRPLTR